jgi:hypothetical protein
VASKNRKSVPTSSDNATVAEAAALLRAVLESVDSAEVPVGNLPRDTATRRRVEGAAAALEAVARSGENKRLPASAKAWPRPTLKVPDAQPPARE